MKLKPPLFVISDTHWLHDRIVEYCGRPADHNERMLANWNKVVGPDDVVLHLGDLVLGPRDENECTSLFWSTSSELNGKKFLLKGNHDEKPNEWYDQHGFEVVDTHCWMKHRGYKITFSHIPVVLTYKNEINVHGHVHNSSFSGLTKRHLNVSVEVIDYTPKNIQSALDYKIDVQL